MQLQIRQSDFKSENLFHTCSVATTLVTSIIISFHFCLLLRCAVFGQIRNSSAVTHINHSPALLKAVLQANTEPLRNALVKMRNQIVEIRTGLETSLIPIQIVSMEAQHNHMNLLTSNRELYDVNPIQSDEFQ